MYFNVVLRPLKIIDCKMFTFKFLPMKHEAREAYGVNTSSHWPIRSAIWTKGSRCSKPLAPI